VLGKNFVKYYTTSVNSDGTYSYDISSGDTQNLAAGQYAIFVQSPMYNGIFDVYPSNDLLQVLGNYPNAGNVLFTIGQTADSAAALKQALDNPGIDDMYTMIQFTVGQPTINIPPITQHMIGDKFTISGTTNLAVSDNILINIISSSFKPTDKTQSGAFSGIGGNTTVVAGPSGGLNTWTFSVDTSNFKADEYLFQASSVETSASSSTSFNVVPYVAPTPTPAPTPVPTVATPVPTPIPTTIVTTVPTSVPTTKSPGFGSLVAITGLIGVAFLVTRRK
jgi:PGF-CTERM protein